MREVPPTVYVARHGETAWSLTGQHTGLNDLPLTANGERNSRRLGERLQGLTFAKVLTSPLQRAARTCELAGLRPVAETDRDLVEWDYGQYEGLRSAEILAARPDWQLFRDGCPGGESPQDVAARADSRGASRPRDRWRCDPVLQRPFSPCPDRPLARPRAEIRREVLPSEHREPQCARLRAQALAARDSPLE